MCHVCVRVCSMVRVLSVKCKDVTCCIFVMTALGTMIFGRRLGCVVKEGTSKAETIHEFVQCIRQLFVESSKMIVLPARVAASLESPVWKRFCAAAERALTLGK